MFRPAQGLVPHPPDPVAETHGEQQKENADNLQKNDVPHSVERLEKTADPPPDAARDNPRPARRFRRGLSLSRHALKHDRTAPCPALRKLGGGLGAGRKVLAGHAARHPHPDPQHPADTLRFHTRL